MAYLAGSCAGVEDAAGVIHQDLHDGAAGPLQEAGEVLPEASRVAHLPGPFSVLAAVVLKYKPPPVDYCRCHQKQMMAASRSLSLNT